MGKSLIDPKTLSLKIVSKKDLYNTFKWQCKHYFFFIFSQTLIFSFIWIANFYVIFCMKILNLNILLKCNAYYFIKLSLTIQHKISCRLKKLIMNEEKSKSIVIKYFNRHLKYKKLIELMFHSSMS